MGGVIRYEHDGDLMRPDESGDWVMYDDWEHMQGEFITLLVKYNNLVEKLGEIYQEA